MAFLSIGNFSLLSCLILLYFHIVWQSTVSRRCLPRRIRMHLSSLSLSFFPLNGYSSLWLIKSFNSVFFRKGYLERPHFATALRLIGLAQNGNPISREAIRKMQTFPKPQFTFDQPPPSPQHSSPVSFDIAYNLTTYTTSS